MVAVPLLLAACTAGGGEAAPAGPAGGAALPQPAAGAYASYAPSQQFGLWVTGVGHVTYAPDVVLLQLGVEAQAPAVSTAQAQAREAMAGVLAVLEGKGIAEKDIQTTRFSIQPVYEWIERQRQQELIGYRVTNQVQAKIRQVDMAGDVIDAAAEAGGDLVRIQGISFSIDDPSPVQAQARELAVKEAVVKAQQIAGAAGIELGEVVYISESTPSMPTAVPFMDMEARAAGAAAPPTQILPGEAEVTARVQMVYSIK
jgi:uncharacterized protein YggE